MRAGLGVSLIPRAASRMNVPGVRYSELRGDEVEWQIEPVWNKASEKLPLISRFCDTLRAGAGKNKPRRLQA